jgi:hypothetical protein
MIYHLLILQNNRNFLKIVQNLTFTLSEIHCLYEPILDRRPDNKNFYKKELNEWLVLTL